MIAVWRQCQDGETQDAVFFCFLFLLFFPPKFPRADPEDREPSRRGDSDDVVEN